MRLELTYAPEAAARVRKMVKQEQECCAFLTFKLRDDADATRLSIVAPEAAREDADLLFKPFQATQGAGIEAIVISPNPCNFNEDLRRLGIGALRAASRVQIAAQDVARFMELTA